MQKQRKLLNLAVLCLKGAMSFITLAFFMAAVAYAAPAAVPDAAYYDGLREQCKAAGSSSCCLSSVASMEQAGGIMLDDKAGECPEGTSQNMLKCIDSFKWCEIPASAEE
jgi:hypothetical protein